MQIIKEYKLSKKELAFMSKALLIRRVEENLLSLYSEGKLNGTLHTCVGQELIGPVVSEHLLEEDFVVSNHRGHGHYIARTGDVKGLIAEIMGKKTGSSGGIGGSQHLVNHRYLSNGIQGGMTPIATGVALSSKLENSEAISVIFIGDGTLGEGVLYESMNIASVWSLPVVFVLENNQYAQSTSHKQSFSGDLEKRAQGFGLQYFKTNTWDLTHLDNTISHVFHQCRNEKIPFFVEIETYRLNSHSKGDDNRDPDEVKKYEAKDLLNLFIAENSKEYEEANEKVNQEISRAVDFANNSSLLETFPNEPFYNNDKVEYFSIESKKSLKRYNELIYEALDALFAEESGLVVIGEDIEFNNEYTPKPYGGAFKVTKDLSSKYSGRVKNTPISESAIIGVGIGLAIAEKKPIVEIMFGDFMTLAFDQILQHASKFYKMYNEKVKVPLIIRTPMGGRRGYGPTHSQSIEKFFLGIPDLLIIALNKFLNPKEVYFQLIKNVDQPALVIENKILYTQFLYEGVPQGFKISQSNERFPTILLTPDGVEPHITILCYGGMVDEVIKAVEVAFDDEDIICEVLIPSLINPMNISPIADSVSKTKKLIIVEEGCGIAAFGSEVLAGLSEQNIQLKVCKRIANNTIIPCSFIAENNLLPNFKNILQAINDFCNE